jgi:hypothetical protein
MPIFIVKIPIRFVNLPNKYYFQDHPEAYQLVIQRVQGWMLWLAGITTQLMALLLLFS